MKQIFTFVFIVLALSFAQAQFTLSPLILYTQLDGTNEVIAELHVTNSSGLDIEITWERTENNMPTTPEQWQSQICDNLYCFAKSKSTGTFTVAANTTINFSVHLIPPGEPAANVSPEVRIKMYPTGDVTKAVTGTYTFGTLVSTSKVNVASIRIFPNPASSFFKVENGQMVENIEVFNILGVKVLQTANLTNNHVDISGLKNGLYFVRLADKKGKVLITQRLQKN